MNYCNNKCNDHYGDLIRDCQIQKPIMPPIPKDEEENGVVISPTPNLTNKRNTMIIPYSMDYAASVHANAITGKAENILTLAFGSRAVSFWFKEMDSVDSFLKEDYGIYALTLPENILIENISVLFQNLYEIDYGDAVLRAKVRLYRCDFDENVFKYIEGTEAIFEPVITGKILQKVNFTAKAKNLNILVKGDSQFSIGIYLEGENINEPQVINVRADAGVTISMESEKIIPVWTY